MKQTLSVLLCLLLTVSLMAGCGSKEKVEAAPDSRSESASAAEEKPMEPAAPINGKEKYDIDATCYQEGFYRIGQDMPEGEYMVLALGMMGTMRLADDEKMEDDSILMSEVFTHNTVVTACTGEFLRLESAIAIPMGEWPAELVISVPEDGDAVLMVGYDIPEGSYILSPSSLERSGVYGEYTIFYSSRYDKTHNGTYVKEATPITLEKGEYLWINHCRLEAA